ncbi:uncharacterized protein LOC114734209 [Neltuma alba]|uniref:uncharacterized protein LOC114734209 n=1 Tax=Neltuma alba TaxID=207710 RepID=UPI0010A365E1|nr:uncharacterized protein LOC114734209 [Prosopis alba]XP_028777600.1 uncharacterized protein LOC114734209 [Prosopis alba]XP_028777602.1 uncharacterized protein LOC114734209 [Prosopis alba]
MVKTKLRHPGTVAGRNSGTPSCLIDNDTSEADQQHDKDGWVIVKKQRVTILIPCAPLPTTISITATHGPSNIASSNFQLQMGTPPLLPSVNEQETTSPLAAQEEIRVARKAPPLPYPTSATNARINRRVESEIPPQVSNLKSPKLLGISRASKAIKQPRVLLAPRRFPNLGTTLNQGLRASNLERKLERAGGLSKWLTSLGLGQFVRIFQGKSLNKYQLVNLTMKKLKDMGANAVGPRRKLIHAIDCVCQPYCFESL